MLFNTKNSNGNSRMFESSIRYLQQSEECIQKENWIGALENCHKFLVEFPLSHRIEDKNTQAYANFRHIASDMLSNNHNYDSVINVLNISRDMTAFTKTFFHDIDKKGVHLPKPKPNKEVVMFIYSFCVSFYNMILAGINE